MEYTEQVVKLMVPLLKFYFHDDILVEVLNFLGSEEWAGYLSYIVANPGFILCTVYAPTWPTAQSSLSLLFGPIKPKVTKKKHFRKEHSIST